MDGTITLKIVAAPNKKTEILIEKTDIKMPASEMRTFNKMIESVEETIDLLNGYSEEN